MFREGRHRRDVLGFHDLGSVESVDLEELHARCWLDWDSVAWDVSSMSATLGFTWLAESEAEHESSGSGELLALHGVSQVRVEEALAAVRKA